MRRNRGNVREDTSRKWHIIIASSLPALLSLIALVVVLAANGHRDDTAVQMPSAIKQGDVEELEVDLTSSPTATSRPNLRPPPDTSEDILLLQEFESAEKLFNSTASNDTHESAGNLDYDAAGIVTTKAPETATNTGSMNEGQSSYTPASTSTTEATATTYIAPTIHTAPLEAYVSTHETGELGHTTTRITTTKATESAVATDSDPWEESTQQSSFTLPSTSTAEATATTYIAPTMHTTPLEAYSTDSHPLLPEHLQSDSSSTTTSTPSATTAHLANDTLFTWPQFPHPVPIFRYQEFSKMSETEQQVARDYLGYTQTTWNVLGYASIERRTWDELSSNQKYGAILLGFDENVWNCYMNHFDSGSWDELTADAQHNWGVLGWTKDSWDTGSLNVPPTEYLWWDELTVAEQTAANQLCFFRANWDSLDMSPNLSYFPYDPPMNRYVPWSEMTTGRTARKLMGYTQQLWNLPQVKGVESKVFHGLTATQKEGARILGFHLQQWNCFMNHYESFAWDSLDDDRKIAFKTLGWTKASWNDPNANYPESDSKDWHELSAEERGACTMLCFFRETWNEIHLSRWYDVDKGVNTAISPQNGIVPISIDMDLFWAG
ncbi:hypothetical protein ACHAWF_013727 [Thalassiosira exigua]